MLRVVTSLCPRVSRPGKDMSLLAYPTCGLDVSLASLVDLFSDGFLGPRPMWPMREGSQALWFRGYDTRQICVVLNPRHITCNKILVAYVFWHTTGILAEYLCRGTFVVGTGIFLPISYFLLVFIVLIYLF
jgi:hypothetical protein